MPSATYRALRQAILEKKRVIADYDDHYRKLCPHAIGTTDGQERVLCYQFGGETSGGRLIRGNSYRNWQCFDVERIVLWETEEGKWWTWPRRMQTTDCISRVDIEVS